MADKVIRAGATVEACRKRARQPPSGQVVAHQLLLRIVQGIGPGGEYGSAVVHVMEHVPDHRRALFTSTLQGTARIGLLVALDPLLLPANKDCVATAA